MSGKPSKRSSKAAQPRKAATESSDQFSASGKIGEMIADLGDWRGEWLAEIRRIIHEVDLEVVEDWKWRGTPVWSHEGMYANANAFKDKVNSRSSMGPSSPTPIISSTLASAGTSDGR